MQPRLRLLLSLLIVSFSGIGQELWQVILGRVITGLGGAGMVTMAAVIITGKF
jgi:MFS family permease